MKYIKFALVYSIIMIITYGHASAHFAKEVAMVCSEKIRIDRTAYCDDFDMIHRPEAMVFSVLWPYYWSERMWEDKGNGQDH